MPPHVLTVPLGPAAAQAALIDALSAEGLVPDGGAGADGGSLTTTFVVRKGGMGEAEIRLQLRLTSDGIPGSEGGMLLRIEATARDRNRMITMSAEEARSPRLSREPHPINEHDRETLGRIARLVDRLSRAGFVVVETRPP